jgi:hypothetical protein
MLWGIQRNGWRVLGMALAKGASPLARRSACPNGLLRLLIEDPWQTLEPRLAALEPGFQLSCVQPEQQQWQELAHQAILPQAAALHARLAPAGLGQISASQLRSASRSSESPAIRVEGASGEGSKPMGELEGSGCR